MKDQKYIEHVVQLSKAMMKATEGYLSQTADDDLPWDYVVCSAVGTTLLSLTGQFIDGQPTPEKRAMFRADVLNALAGLHTYIARKHPVKTTAPITQSGNGLLH